MKFFLANKYDRGIAKIAKQIVAPKDTDKVSQIESITALSFTVVIISSELLFKIKPANGAMINSNSNPPKIANTNS